MNSNVSRGAVDHESFQPWFRFGPILILILYWLGSTSGYIFSCLGEFVPWCFPHIEGCTSISRTGRFGTSFLHLQIYYDPRRVPCFRLLVRHGSLEQEFQFQMDIF